MFQHALIAGLGAFNIPIDPANLPYLMYPWMGLFLLAVPVAVWLRYRRQDSVVHTNVDLHDNLGGSIFGRVPVAVFIVVLSLFVAAATRPVQDYTVETQIVEAHEIVLGVDYSGSMDGRDIPGGARALLPPGFKGCQNGEHKDDPENTPDAPNQPDSMRRINAACFAVVNFVSHRAGDRIGLIMFNDSASWLLPLWFEQKVIVRQASLINLHGTSGGTNFTGPDKSSSNLGPIQAGINHLAVYGQGQSKVMIMVTDGEDSISDERNADFAEQLAKQGIHLYVLGVGPGWFKEGDGPDLRKLVTLVGGKVFPVKDAQSLQGAFEEINKLEPSKIHREVAVKHHELAYLPLGLAVILILIFLPFALLTREQA